MALLVILIFLTAIVRGEKTYSLPPSFPLKYVTQGVLNIPYSEIKEPFSAWYDGLTGSSRVDYYGGMVKTYQLSKVGPYGQLSKIAPVTTEISMNVDTCMQVNGTSAIRIVPQSVLPDLSGYKYMGEKMTRGILAEKWQYKETVGDRSNQYTMYLRYKKSSENPDKKTAVPIQFVMKGMNVVFGSHFDHYWLDYDNFSDETPDESVFKIDGMQCQGFPGPGEDHFYTFNPMKEFVRNSDVTSVLDSSFSNFVHLHGKNYNDSAEHAFRKYMYNHNLRYIHSVNRAGLGYMLAVNRWADHDPRELKYLRGFRRTSGYNKGSPFTYNAERAKTLPEYFDWRLYGAVTPVKDQSVCGSCWSFGTTGAVEGAYFVKYRHLVRLSQQALIDCSWGFGNNGCDGGEDFRAYSWMLKHGGLPTEDDYGPYEGQDGYCHINNVTLTAKISGWVNVTAGDPVALKVALLEHGPISVAIDASHRSFSFYSHGVYYEPNCGNKENDLDHAVLLVGYGKLNGKDYWLVKNSWSNLWGNDGFVLMSPYKNNCGVMTAPTFVTF